MDQIWPLVLFAKGRKRPLAAGSKRQIWTTSRKIAPRCNKAKLTAFVLVAL